jgi:23S rRNA pseudouridine955/2504/2580 synthase
VRVAHINCVTIAAFSSATFQVHESPEFIQTALKRVNEHRKNSETGGWRPKPVSEITGTQSLCAGKVFNAPVCTLFEHREYTVMQSPGKAAVSKVSIGSEQAGQRLDNFLFRMLKGVPKSRIYRMLREGELRVSGRRSKPDYKLVEGDEIRIPPVRVAEKAETPPMSSLTHPLLDRVIYRDDALLIIDKPAGQAVHGGSGISLGVIEQLRQELPDARFLELAHRLDKETSGILVLALKRSALVELHRMLRDGEPRKTYLALAVGEWRDPIRHIKLSLHKFLTEDGERRVEVNDEGQRAHTIFRRIKVVGGQQSRSTSACTDLAHPLRVYSLLEAELKTGRTHQIRVHLAAVHHPIAGDTKYGDAGLNRTLKHQGLRRMFLHSARLEIRHPLTGAELKLEAPLPADLQGFLDSLN